jgi:hypothetical protein
MCVRALKRVLGYTPQCSLLESAECSLLESAECSLLHLVVFVTREHIHMVDSPHTNQPPGSGVKVLLQYRDRT